MKKYPKTGTGIKIEVLDKSLRAELSGSSEELINILINLMMESEQFEDVIMTASRTFAIHKLKEKVEGSEDGLSGLLKNFLSNMSEEDRQEVKDNPAYDFSNVKDLLSEEERKEAGL